MRRAAARAVKKYDRMYAVMGAVKLSTDSWVKLSVTSTDSSRANQSNG
jgi:hypothetical protein